MKFHRVTPDRIAWRLSLEEWRLFRLVTELFPLVPPDHHRLSQSRKTSDLPVDEPWLRQSMSSHVTELKRTLDSLLQRPETGRALKLELQPAQLEHLLQVLNDIRVGSWLQLGSPDQAELAQHEASTPHLVFAMEYSAWIQGQVLNALRDPNDQSPQ